jgi:hypothetical protein
MAKRKSDKQEKTPNVQKVKAEVFDVNTPIKVWQFSCAGCSNPSDTLVCQECRDTAAAASSAPDVVIELQGAWPKAVVAPLVAPVQRSPETHKVIGGIRYVYRDGFLIRKEIAD